VSTYSGISPLIEKYNAGVVFDPFNYNNLLNKLNEIFSNSTTYENLINNGYKLLNEENLTLESIVKKTIELYKFITK
ncbi:MAG: hypothetical protein ACP5U0_08480, partial [Caldisphaera sp.]